MRTHCPRVDWGDEVNRSILIEGGHLGVLFCCGPALARSPGHTGKITPLLRSTRIVTAADQCPAHAGIIPVLPVTETVAGTCFHFLCRNLLRRSVGAAP